MALGAALAGIGSWLAANPGVVSSALGVAGSAIGALSGRGTSGYFGQQSSGSSYQEGGGSSSGGGYSQSGSTSGTNDDQIAKWLAGAYQYQDQSIQKQGDYNWKSMLTQMGYNTLGAIQQGVYNSIQQNAAMSYNSSEALANREWQERMSNTSYQRAVEDMKAAGLNPILAYANGGASTPGGSAGSISQSSMGMASTSAASIGTQHGFVPNSYSSESWSSSEWYNFASQFSRAASEQQSSPVELAYKLQKVNNAGTNFDKTVNREMGGGKTSGKGAGRNK